MMSCSISPNATRIPLRGCGDQDALTRARHLFHWHPGIRRAVKRCYWRRFRRTVRVALARGEWV
jgi:hypothetical protein